MVQYHKIQTVFKRDPDTNFKTLLDGKYSISEFEYLKDNRWVFTEKVDGTNIRVMFNGDVLTFGGKSDNASIPSNLLNRLNDRFVNGATKFSDIFGDDISVCLYGEGYGAKIQKGGGNYRQDQDFVLFDVKVGDWWLHRNDVNDIAIKLGLDIVPVIGAGTLSDMIKQTSYGIKSIWGDFMAEGIVARPEVELKSRDGKRIITKLKVRDFKVTS